MTLDGVSRLRTITLTVFVPDVELADCSELNFRTVGIHATRRRAIAGAPGAEVTTEPLQFEGLAWIVEFPRGRVVCAAVAGYQACSAWQRGQRTDVDTSASKRQPQAQE